MEKLKNIKTFEEFINTRADVVSGGKGDGTQTDEVDPKELQVGVAVELEHTGNEETAKEIAIDHLTENPKYYTKLIKSGIVDEPEAIKLAKDLLGVEPSKASENVQEAQHIDVTWALKSIKDYNKGISKSNSLTDLAIEVVKHLGYKTSKNNVEATEDHLSVSANGHEIPEDKSIVRELYDILENVNEASGYIYGGISVTVLNDKSITIDDGDNKIRMTSQEQVKKMIKHLESALRKM